MGGYPDSSTQEQIARVYKNRKLIISLAIIFGILLFAFGTYLAIAQYDLSANGVNVSARVIRNIQGKMNTKGGLVDAYTPVFQYIGKDNVIYEATSTITSTSKFEEGSLVDIVYDSRNPNHAEITSSILQFIIMLYVASVIAFLVALFVRYYTSGIETVSS